MKTDLSVSYGFSNSHVWYESWNIKKTECQRIDAFEQWYCRRLLRVPLEYKEIKPVDLKGNYSWIFIGNGLENPMDRGAWQAIIHGVISVRHNLVTKPFTERTDAEAPILWPPNVMKRPWCWERLKAGEGDDRGWDGWMALPTWWTWVWTSSGSWWWTGKPGIL